MVKHRVYTGLVLPRTLMLTVAFNTSTTPIKTTTWPNCQLMTMARQRLARWSRAMP